MNDIVFAITFSLFMLFLFFIIRLWASGGAGKSELFKEVNEAWMKRQTFGWSAGSLVNIWFMYRGEKYHSLCGYHIDSEDGNYHLTDIYQITKVWPGEQKIMFDATEKIM